MAGRVGPARSGRRTPELLQAAPPAEDPSVGGSVTLYVACARPLRVGELDLVEGVEVPGAEGWQRVETWVSARRIRKISADEPHVPFAVFESWVNDDQGMSLEEYHAQHEVAAIEAELAEEPEQTEE